MVDAYVTTMSTSRMTIDEDSDDDDNDDDAYDTDDERHGYPSCSSIYVSPTP